MKVLCSQRLKMPFLSGIINIDSNSLSLEIFQMTKEGKEVLENLDQNINLNTDISKRGAISLKKISLVCNVMQEFANKLLEYDIKYYRAMIDCAVREATNCDILINRIKTTSRIDIESIPPAEEIRLLFLLIREQICGKYNFQKINTLSFAIGSSVLLLIIAKQGKLIFCESIPLNLIRSFDKYGNYKTKPHRLLSLLKSLNSKQNFHAKNFQYILIGADKNTRALVNINKRYNDSDFIELASSKLKSTLNKLSDREMINKYQISDLTASKFVFQKHIIMALIEIFKPKKTLFPTFSINDALAADMVHDKSKLFENEIIRVAEGIGDKYNYNAARAKNVTVNCLKIFDKLHKKHDLSKRSRLLLHLAALLHDIGCFIDLKQYQKHSYYLIRNTQLPGISENEQLIIATVASCHKKRIPRKHPKYAALTKDEKNIITKLSSILSIGDMLDNFNPHDSSKISIRLNKNNLTIKTPNYSEDLLEQINISAGRNLFNETFGLEIKLYGTHENYGI